MKKLPINVRPGDIVEIIGEDDTHYGLLAKIKKVSPDYVIVDLFGKEKVIPLQYVTLKARLGSHTHDDLTEQINAQELSHLDEIGYDALINFAIDARDWTWAKDLVDRKMEYINRKGKEK